MSTPLVIYGSVYGYTRRYAEWIAEDLGGHAIAAAEVTPEHLDAAGMLVIGASDYAGKLTEADRIRALAPALRGHQLAYFTVSFSGTAGGTSPQKLDDVLRKSFGEAYDQTAPTAHFRGGLDFTRLSRTHRTAMIGIRAFMKSKREKTVTDRQMIEAYGGTVDYSDRAELAPFIARLRAF